MLQIIKPCKEYLDSYYEACVESRGHLHDNYIMHDPEKYDEWKDCIFEIYQKNEKGIDLPNGFIPSTTRWIVEDGEYIGTLNVRQKTTSVLMEWGGTVGIAIRYGKRGKGYAARAFEEFRKQKDLKDYIVDDFLVATVEQKNLPSINTLRVWKESIKKEETYVTKVNGVDSEVYRALIDKDELFYV